MTDTSSEYVAPEHAPMQTSESAPVDMTPHHDDSAPVADTPVVADAPVDPKDARIAELEAQLRDRQAVPADVPTDPKDARIAELESQVASLSENPDAPAVTGWTVSDAPNSTDTGRVVERGDVSVIDPQGNRADEAVFASHTDPANAPVAVHREQFDANGVYTGSDDYKGE